MPEVVFDYTPQPRQQLFHKTKARQILYGGAAGGGKSRSLRADAIIFCLQNPGCQAYLFRRTMRELEDNHIKWVKTEIPPELGTYNHSRNEFSFFNGSMLNFCYCENERDVTRYQGAEMHWVGIDEAAHFTDFQINYLKTRNRLGGWTPTVDRERLPRFAMASNPGGPGHNYLKAIFIDQSTPEEIFYDTTMRDPQNEEDRGWPSIFIPATMADNSYLDSDYASSFSAGLPPELVEALRNGDWDAVVGKALHNLSRERHMLRAFTPPKFWTHFQVIDWGTASPFSVGWYCVSEGAELKGDGRHPPRWLPEGAIIRFREWYGWDGHPNKGCRMSAQHVAHRIVHGGPYMVNGQQFTAPGERDLPPMDYRVGDTDMWADRGMRSVAEIMAETEASMILKKAKKDRVQNYAEVISRLAGNPEFMKDGEEEDPMFFCTENCTHFWRTVPVLTLDDNDHEKGPATDGEDHCLSGLTKVYIRSGETVACADLEDLSCYPDFDEIWTPKGWKPFIDLGRTGTEETFTVRLMDGQEFTATAGHPILCSDNQYRRVDELTYNDYVVSVNIPTFWFQTKWHSISRARHIGNVEITGRDAVSACTGLFGNFITGLSRKVSTFITRTATATITALRIWSYSQLLTTCGNTQIRQSVLSTLDGIWKKECARRQPNGTARKKGGNGILKGERPTEHYRRVLSLYVRNVVRRVLRKAGTGSFVPISAISGALGVGILDIIPTHRKEPVYNLHVPDVNAFVIQGGAVVHNCYDEVAYACRSRPFVTTEDDRYMAEWGEQIREARGYSGDPYATA